MLPSLELKIMKICLLRTVAVSRSAVLARSDQNSRMVLDSTYSERELVL